MRYVLVMLLMLSGCAGQEFWHEVPGAPLPEHIDIVTLPSVAAWCSQWPGAIACTICDPIARTCTVYLSQAAATHCNLVHELTHAAGFAHYLLETNSGCFFH